MPVVRLLYDPAAQAAQADVPVANELYAPATQAWQNTELRVVAYAYAPYGMLRPKSHKVVTGLDSDGEPGKYLAIRDCASTIFVSNKLGMQKNK